MIRTIEHLGSLKMRPPICIGVHALFTGNAYQELLASGVEKIITCNTIKHISNGINISNNIIELLKEHPDFS
jgi:ribose-phosphate pyrophosphokinase